MSLLKSKRPTNSQQVPDPNQAQNQDQNQKDNHEMFVQGDSQV